MAPVPTSSIGGDIIDRFFFSLPFSVSLFPFLSLFLSLSLVFFLFVAFTETARTSLPRVFEISFSRKRLTRAGVSRFPMRALPLLFYRLYIDARLSLTKLSNFIIFPRAFVPFDCKRHRSRLAKRRMFHRFSGIKSRICSSEFSSSRMFNSRLLGEKNYNLGRSLMNDSVNENFMKSQRYSKTGEMGNKKFLCILNAFPMGYFKRNKQLRVRNIYYLLELSLFLQIILEVVQITVKFCYLTLYSDLCFFTSALEKYGYSC